VSSSASGGEPRVAVHVPAEAIDRERLATLAAEHPREDTLVG
jgi:hypothetical protein